MVDKWILIVDFNDITSNEEKWGGRLREEWTFTHCKQFISASTLVDVGYEGVPWTWSNLSEEEGKIKQRFDTGPSSNKWAEWF